MLPDYPGPPPNWIEHMVYRWWIIMWIDVAFEYLSDCLAQDEWN